MVVYHFIFRFCYHVPDSIPNVLEFLYFYIVSDAFFYSLYLLFIQLQQSATINAINHEKYLTKNK